MVSGKKHSLAFTLCGWVLIACIQFKTNVLPAAPYWLKVQPESRLTKASPKTLKNLAIYSELSSRAKRNGFATYRENTTTYAAVIPNKMDQGGNYQLQLFHLSEDGSAQVYGMPLANGHNLEPITNLFIEGTTKTVNPAVTGIIMYRKNTGDTTYSGTTEVIDNYRSSKATYTRYLSRTKIIQDTYAAMGLFVSYKIDPTTGDITYNRIWKKFNSSGISYEFPVEEVPPTPKLSYTIKNPLNGHQQPTYMPLDVVETGENQISVYATDKKVRTYQWDERNKKYIQKGVAENATHQIALHYKSYYEEFSPKGVKTKKGERTENIGLTNTPTKPAAADSSQM